MEADCNKYIIKKETDSQKTITHIETDCQKRINEKETDFRQKEKHLMEILSQNKKDKEEFRSITELEELLSKSEKERHLLQEKIYNFPCLDKQNSTNESLVSFELKLNKAEEQNRVLEADTLSLKEDIITLKKENDDNFNNMEKFKQFFKKAKEECKETNKKSS